MLSESVPVVTIDGPGGSGKGTVSLLLAERLGWHFLDSGALYRLVAVAAMDSAIEPHDEAALTVLAGELDVEFAIRDHALVVLMHAKRVEDKLRSEDVSVFASRVAALAGVRQALVGRQRNFRRRPGLVADGRDMGTVIFPDADLKIYLTASAEERANRRHKQLKEKGESVNLSRLFHDIEERDERDRSRGIAPLRPAEDAHIIDSTELSIEMVLQEIMKLLKESKVTN